MQFDLVVPVKPLGLAKSRLRGLPRAPLMRAFALDALSACVASPLVRAVHVVTDDDDLVVAATTIGCHRLPDRGDGSLNRALSLAAQELPDGAGVAALLGDLPCLVADDLTSALTEVPASGVVVADADGTGSTMLAAPSAADFRPRFGAGSFRAHLEAGYSALTLAVPTLRRDVDTAADLATAVALGVGAHTLEALRTHEGR